MVTVNAKCKRCAEVTQLNLRGSVVCGLFGESVFGLERNRIVEMLRPPVKLCRRSYCFFRLTSRSNRSPNGMPVVMDDKLLFDNNLSQ